MTKRDINNINLILALVNSANSKNEDLYYIQHNLDSFDLESEIEFKGDFSDMIIYLDRYKIILEKIALKDIKVLRLEKEWK